MPDWTDISANHFRFWQQFGLRCFWADRVQPNPPMPHIRVGRGAVTNGVMTSYGSVWWNVGASDSIAISGETLNRIFKAFNEDENGNRIDGVLWDIYKVPLTTGILGERLGGMYITNPNGFQAQPTDDIHTEATYINTAISIWH